MSKLKLDTLIVSKTDTLKEAMGTITAGRSGIAFVTEGEKLVGVISDGDIRRALLSGAILITPVHKVLNTNYISSEKKPKKELLQILKREKITVLPIVDKDGNLLDVFYIYENE